MVKVLCNQLGGNCKVVSSHCRGGVQLNSVTRLRSLLPRRSSLKTQNRADPNSKELIKLLQGEINHLLEREDIKWKQRAKRNWFWQEDKNTKFFHAWANHRRKINQINSITDEMGTLRKEPEDVDRIFVQYFQGLFSTSSPSGIEANFARVPTGVTEAMNDMLISEFKVEEVDYALSHMHPLKAPGTNGFSACFFQQHWATVGHEVRHAVLSFLNSSHLDADVNATYIALVPKVSPFTKVTAFRPISLCNVLYKLIAKVLANRLKKVLPSLISSSKSAFIPN